jgi:HSP20 family protein
VASLVRWEPLSELATLQTELSRLMNGLSGGNGRSVQSWVPPVDIWETESDLVYAFDLPGISQDKITLDLHEGTLTVSGERENKQERSEDGFFRFERRYGSFSRSLPVPPETQEESVRAEYRNGVLEIRVAKPEVSKPRRIKIGGQSGSEHKTIEGKASEHKVSEGKTSAS